MYSRIFPHIQAYSHLFRYNQVYSGIFQSYSGIFRTLYNPGIFRTLAYSELEACSEPWRIQNPGVLTTLEYSEPCQTSSMKRFANIINGYNYFRNISLSRSLLCEKTMYFCNTCLIFTPEVFI